MLTLMHSGDMAEAMFGQANAQTTAEKVVDKLPPAKDVLPRVQALLQQTRANLQKMRAAERGATLIGVGGGVVGVGLGAAAGRWAGSGNRIVTTVGAGAGAFGLGLLAFFISRRILMPPLDAGEIASATAAAAGDVAIEATGAAASAAAAEGALGWHYPDKTPTGYYDGALGWHYPDKTPTGYYDGVVIDPTALVRPSGLGYAYTS